MLRAACLEGLCWYIAEDGPGHTWKDKILAMVLRQGHDMTDVATTCSKSRLDALLLALIVTSNLDGNREIAGRGHSTDADIPDEMPRAPLCQPELGI